MELQHRSLHTNARLHAQRTLIALTCLSAPLSAAAQISVEVSPLRVELKVVPGATHTQAVTLVNQGAVPVRIRARVEDWHLSRDGTPQFTPVEPGAPYSAAAWVRLAPPEQVVEPGKVATVRFTTTVPADAVEAGYRSAILFEFAPPGGDLVGRGRDVVFRSRVATLVYVNVGNPAAAVELVDLRVRVGPNRAADLVAVLRNSSRANVRTSGTLVITTPAGHLVRKVDVPNVPVLPESEREVVIATGREDEPPLPPGDYRVEVQLDVGLPALLVGETTMKIPG
jgi:P pilus assembly chaperone PapD